MSNCAGRLVNNACAYALKSDGIVALWRMATYTKPQAHQSASFRPVKNN